MSATRSVYKVMRSVLFSAILTVMGLLALLYVLVSVPSVQRELKERAERELTSLLGGRVSISSVDIFPFNEVRLHGVSLYSPDGRRCLSVGRLGAGIDLWSLVSSGEIEIAYAEIISMNARIEQTAENAPLNIQFVIDALSGKDKKSPPSQFRVVLRNVVIRKSSVSFDRTYVPRQPDTHRMDFSHIALSDFRADVALPLLANDDFSVDLRRLAFNEKSGLSVGGISVKARITPYEISFTDFRVKVGNSVIRIGDQSLGIHGYSDIVDALGRGFHSFAVSASPLYPSDFAAFCPVLSEFSESLIFDTRICGNAGKAVVEDFTLRGKHGGISLSLTGSVEGAFEPASMSGAVESLDVRLSEPFGGKLLEAVPGMSEKVRTIASSAGDVSVRASGSFDLGMRTAGLSADIGTSAGQLVAAGEAAWSDGKIILSRLSLKTDAFDAGLLAGDDRIGLAGLDVSGSMSVCGGVVEGDVKADVPFFDYNSTRFENISLRVSKSSDHIVAHVDVNDNAARLDADADCTLAGAASLWNVDADVERLVPSCLGLNMPSADAVLSGSVRLSASGNTPDNMSGRLDLLDFGIKSASPLHIDRFSVAAEVSDQGRTYDVDSDFMTGSVSGDFHPESLFAMIKGLVSSAVPALLPGHDVCCAEGQRADLNLTLHPSDALYAILRSPVRPGVPVVVSGMADGSSRTVGLSVDAPYLVKGRDKLVKQTRIDVCLKDSMPASVDISAMFPMKNDYADIDISVRSADNHADADIRWSMDGNRDNTGRLGVGLDIARLPFNNSVSLSASLHDSGFRLNGADWTVSPARIDYSDRSLAVSDMRIAHGLQFVDIHGTASTEPLDVLTAELAGIDLEYIFNILNINHVDFGGIATGSACVSGLFTKAPVARTNGLFVKDLAYNGSVLGDGQLESHWDNDSRMVAINADISAADSSSATVRGGVYVTRDSLSFDFHADKLDIGFLKPFMSGFTSSVAGRASGDVKLYGTFSDIDLAGKVFADTITMKVDYTNVYYSGSDSVFFSPGLISIPGIRLYDSSGNSCRLRGEVRHRFLKDPAFNFDMTEARKLLVYDTGAKMNPKWYGRVFADGSASLRGRPGLVSLDINMRTASDSEFTLVLDETQTAVDYTFLTFSDRRKHLLELADEKEQSFEDRFRKDLKPALRERPDLFSLDMALDVTPGAKLVIVMDPQAGDKIKAEGRGAMQMHYDSDSDELSLYGKYTLDRGDYNFSLQDLILKNFKIRGGSSISFNGDPLAGILDITAAYRVNTNLTDLDVSFQSDPDLNRTSVPVDALLRVRGDIQAPEISFDLSLPTVTSEVERKVRSIVSTDDMMNRQVIYLLALNRFYTPEYMGAEQGGELASVASSTLSSQLQNIIGSLTDKLSVAPSFKSEKSDLSDMEVDLALSSSLFDNRLFINGNLGYRDRSTSQTTFIGDFDIEYLLSRDGRLRLKAYNHFNDASYYLKSALTTQGIGVIYRKDFDDPFTFIKRMFRKRKKTVSESQSTETKSKKK